MKKFDYYLFILIILIAALGIMTVNTATNSLESSTFVRNQIIAFTIGFVVLIFISRLNPLTFKKASIPTFIISILLLMSVLIFGTGLEETGSKSWIYIGRFGFQPSEFVKIGFIISFSAHIANKADKLNSPKALAGLVVHTAAVVIPVLMQPDFGTAFVFIFLALVMLFFSGLSKWYYLLGTALITAAAPVIWLNLKEYQKNRILVFLNPELDPSGAGYNVIQSKTALGSGGLFGQGYLNGMLTQSDMLPSKHTDFIFSVIGEEAGFVGCFAVILLLFLIIMRFFSTYKKTPYSFEASVASGLSAMLFCHTVINTGMCVGLVPVTGIPLPFISYGGTFVISNMAAAGIIISIRSHLPEDNRNNKHRKGYKPYSEG